MTAAIARLNRRTFASLGQRNYRLFFAGQVVSVTGTWMQNVALAWLVLELTGSAVAVGVLVFCRFLPFTLFGLVAGVVADRLDNRRLVIGTQAAEMGVSAALAALAFSGAAAPWQIYALAALGGTAHVFGTPARHSFTFELVGRKQLPNAVALNSSLFNGARIAGPAAGGIVVAAAGAGACFAVNTVSFLAVLAGLLLMRTDELHSLERGDTRPALLAGVREGLSYAWREPRVRLVLVLTAAVSAVGFNFHVLVPVLAAQTLHAGPEVLGALTACFGAGALLGALLAAAIGRASRRLLLGGSGGLGVALLLLAPQRTAVAAGVLLFAAGACFVLWTSNSQSILQLGAPDHLRGRVLGLWLFAFAGLAPAGGLLTGWLSAAGGTTLAFGVGGAVTVLASGAAFIERRRLAAL